MQKVINICKSLHLNKSSKHKNIQSIVFHSEFYLYLCNVLITYIKQDKNRIQENMLLTSRYFILVHDIMKNEFQKQESKSKLTT